MTFDLDKFISNYSLGDILYLEEFWDLQYIALKDSWTKLTKSRQMSNYDESLFISLVIINSLLSYQLSWKWEDRWKEFWEYVFSNFDKFDNILEYKNFLANSKNNRRLLNMKLKRFDKIIWFFENYKKIDDYIFFYDNMELLNKELAKYLKQKLDAKTVVFAVKMFWYACRVVLEKTNTYPYSIKIPLDSRIKKIYELNNKWKYSDNEVLNYFDKLSQKYNIPPLHMDTLLWVKYWQTLN